MTINCYLLHKYWFPNWKPSAPFKVQSYNIFVHDLIKSGLDNYMKKCNESEPGFPLISPQKKESKLTRDTRYNLDYTKLCVKVTYQEHYSKYPSLFRDPRCKTPTIVRYNCLQCKSNRNKFNQFCELQGWSRKSLEFKNYHKTQFKKLIGKNRVQIGKYLCKCKLCRFNGLTSMFCNPKCWKNHNHHKHI